jgi:hypothetical protein
LPGKTGNFTAQMAVTKLGQEQLFRNYLVSWQWAIVTVSLEIACDKATTGLGKERGFRHVFLG